MKHLLVILFVTLSILLKTHEKNAIAQGNETVVYVIRHGEKASNSDDDPELSQAGKTRAEALKGIFNSIPLNAVYVTSYKRSLQTGLPVAHSKNLMPQVYDAQDVKVLASKILKEHPKQTVLIVGHSNTVLEIIEAFKAKRPIPQLTTSDYKYLFKVTIPEKGEPKVEVSQY